MILAQDIMMQKLGGLQLLIKLISSQKNLANFNRYVYANNNPYKYVNPDGKFPVFAVCRRLSIRS